LNAVMLAVSARQGETTEIAAYTVMTAALAWVSIATAGGSSLLYTTGTEAERQAVLSQRFLIVLPSLVAAAALVTLAYTGRGYNSVALASAGVVVLGNNLFEVQSADLVRQMRFVLGAVVTCGGKCATLAFILVGAPLTTALAVMAIAQFIVIEALLCRGELRRPPMWHKLSVRMAGRAFLLNRQLFVVGVSGVFIWRGPSTVLSMAAPPQVVGSFGALISGVQALFGVFHEGLRVPMAIRTRRRHSLGPASTSNWDSELMIVTASVLIAGTAVISAPWVTGEVLGLSTPEAAFWLQLLAISLPCLTIIQAAILNRIGDGDYRGATRLSLLVTILTALLLAAQLPGALGATEAARTHTVAAVSALGILCVLATYRWVSRRRSRPGGRLIPESSPDSSLPPTATASGSRLGEQS
jgi:hypothetical protein